MERLFSKYFQKKLFLADNKTIAANQTFDGDTEEGVVIDIFAAGAGCRSAGRTASTESTDCEGGNGNEKKFFHFFSPLLKCFIELLHGVLLVLK